MVLCNPPSALSKEALLANVYSPYFATLDHIAKTALAIQDIESNQFWKAVYCLLRAVFPPLRAFRSCDVNKPAMDKIFIVVIRLRMLCLDLAIS